MLDLVPVATIVHEGSTVDIEYMTAPADEPKTNCVFAKYILGNWIVFKRDAEIVSGELEDAIVNYCNREFPSENVLSKPRKKSFLLKGNDDEQ